MITLTDFITKDQYSLPENYSLDSFMETNDLTPDNITNHALNWYAHYVCEGNYWANRDHLRADVNDAPPEQIIQEMLRSISIQKLKDVLNRELGGNSKYNVTIVSDKIEGLQVYELKISRQLYNPEKIVEICDRMMWVFSEVSEDRKNTPGYSPLDKSVKLNPNAEYYIMAVEPQYADNVTDFVKKNCKGILYHIVEHEDVFMSILHSGLRMKGERNDYRLMKNKVYFVCGENTKQLIQNIKTVAISKLLWNKKKNCLKKNIYIIAADVSNYNVNFYDDTGYNEKTKEERKGIVYSYAYFPPKLLHDATKEITNLLK